MADATTAIFAQLDAMQTSINKVISDLESQIQGLRADLKPCNCKSGSLGATAEEAWKAVVKEEALKDKGRPGSTHGDDGFTLVTGRHHKKTGGGERSTGEDMDDDLASTISTTNGCPGPGAAGTRVDCCGRVVYGKPIPGIFAKSSETPQTILGGVVAVGSDRECQVEQGMQIRELFDRLKALEAEMDHRKVVDWSADATKRVEYYPFRKNVGTLDM